MNLEVKILNFWMILELDKLEMMLMKMGMLLVNGLQLLYPTPNPTPNPTNFPIKII